MSWKSVAAAAVLVLAAHTAVADESGTFQMLRSYQHSYITVDHGSHSFTGGILRGTNTIRARTAGRSAWCSPAARTAAFPSKRRA